MLVADSKVPNHIVLGTREEPAYKPTTLPSRKLATLQSNFQWERMNEWNGRTILNSVVLLPPTYLLCPCWKAKRKNIECRYCQMWPVHFIHFCISPLNKKGESKEHMRFSQNTKTLHCTSNNCTLFSLNTELYGPIGKLMDNLKPV